MGLQAGDTSGPAQAADEGEGSRAVVSPGRGVAISPDIHVCVVFLSVQDAQQGGVFIVSEIECTVIYS